MSQSPAPAKKSSRVRDYIILLILILVIVGAAFYQEQLQSFISMRLWDKGAPARQVEKFLTAMKAGDKSTSDSVLDTSIYKEMNEGGKWNGYFITTQAGRMNYRINETVPAGEIKAKETEFVFSGAGAANVTIQDGKGNPVVYRLQMDNGSWKIKEMRGGYPDAPPKNNNSGKNQPKRTFTPPGATPSKAKQPAK